ncbi:hypothetical protein ALP43_200284 [Pseudomonas azotoformans]|nr:hypothetical protein ALP43_200284 [Pseudomonas azotoformans]
MGGQVCAITHIEAKRGKALLTKGDFHGTDCPLVKTMNAASMKPGPMYVCVTIRWLRIPNGARRMLPSKKILPKWNSENWSVCLAICEPAATAMDIWQDLPGNERWLCSFVCV